ncbi:MAG: hypothetical protein JXM79_03305 [Sedimentisphaerales bacterium]|nr:hypothetical protein [Sedimentisphaerales bacterium]
MRLQTLYACLIAMLLASTTTLGDIIMDPESTGTSCGATADAGPGNTEDEWYEEAWYFEYTDEEGDFDWEISAYAWVYCSATQIGGSALAVASASGAAASPYSVVSASASLSKSNGSGTDDDVDSDSSITSQHFKVNQGVAGTCDAYAYASIEEGSESDARAIAVANGYATMG